MARTRAAGAIQLRGTFTAPRTDETEIRYLPARSAAAFGASRIGRAFHLYFFEFNSAFFTNKLKYRHMTLPV